MSSAQLISVAVGMPKERGVVGSKKPMERPFESGIFKAPVSEPVWLGALNLAGDGQSDLDNHGGLFRAVLAYGAERYPVWREALNMPDLPYGAFGENFTVSMRNQSLTNFSGSGSVSLPPSGLRIGIPFTRTANSPAASNWR